MSDIDDPYENLPAFQLRDLGGQSQVFPSGHLTLLCFVKEDCPTCRSVLPILRQWKEDYRGQLSLHLIGQTRDGNLLLRDQHEAGQVLDDSDLLVSYRYQVEVVPTLILADSEGRGLTRVQGFCKADWQALEARVSSLTQTGSSQVDWDSFPELRPGCGSLSTDPVRAERLQAELDGNPLRARRIETGSQDDFEFLFEQGFSDGLPLIPPTPERVRRMLSGTRRSPREVVAVVPPNMARATVEKVAINAVMAGCRPDYLPVVLGALEAVCTDEFNIHGILATTMGAAPVMVVNGPIRRSIGMNMEQGALGQGNRANATIGRALRLVLRNVGGARPGGIERSTLGNPMKFTMCFAEWEEASPWEALHVERGFALEESVVTVFGMSSGPTLVVDQSSRSASQLAGSFGLAADHALHPRAHGYTNILLVISPEHVVTLKRDGYGKSEIRRRIQEVTAVPLRELVSDEISGVGLDPEEAARLLREELDRPTPKFSSEEDIHIVVAGGRAGKFSGIFHGWAIGPRGTQPVSRLLEDLSK